MSLKHIFTKLGARYDIRLEGIMGALVLINLLLAVVALVKDMTLAAYLGTSQNADALLLAFFIPDTVGNNLLASALGVAAIPVLSKLYSAGDKNRLLKCFTCISILAFAASILIYGVLYLLRGPVVRLIGSGLSQDGIELCTRLFILLLPSIIIFPLISLGISLSQVLGRFKLSSLAPVLFNSFFLLGLLYGILFKVPGSKGVYIAALSILFGVAAMTLLVWIALRKGIRMNAVRLFSEKGLLRSAGVYRDIAGIIKAFIPYLLALLLSQSVFFFERYLASRAGTGSIAALNYAYRLSQFPIWVFVAAVSTVAFPSLSRLDRVEQQEEFEALLVRSLSLVGILIIPLSLILFIMRVPIISTLFMHGAFDSNSLNMTSSIAAGYFLAIVGQGIIFICARVFLSAGFSYIPLLVSFGTAVVNITVDFYLVPKIGTAGLGIGASSASVFGAILAIYMVKVRLDIKFSKYADRLNKVVLSNIPVLLLSLLLCKLWYFLPVDAGMLLKVTFTCTAVLMCILVYIPIWVYLMK